jgi:uncharacterized protein YqfB (UPF0267 family)
MYYYDSIQVAVAFMVLVFTYILYSNGLLQQQISMIRGRSTSSTSSSEVDTKSASIRHDRDQEDNQPISSSSESSYDTTTTTTTTTMDDHIYCNIKIMENDSIQVQLQSQQVSLPSPSSLHDLQMLVTPISPTSSILEQVELEMIYQISSPQKEMDTNDHLTVPLDEKENRNRLAMEFEQDDVEEESVVAPVVETTIGDVINTDELPIDQVVMLANGEAITTGSFVPDNNYLEKEVMQSNEMITTPPSLETETTAEMEVNTEVSDEDSISDSKSSLSQNVVDSGIQELLQKYDAQELNGDYIDEALQHIEDTNNLINEELTTAEKEIADGVTVDQMSSVIIDQEIQYINPTLEQAEEILTESESEHYEEEEYEEDEEYEEEESVQESPQFGEVYQYDKQVVYQQDNTIQAILEMHKSNFQNMIADITPYHSSPLHYTPVQREYSFQQVTSPRTQPSVAPPVVTIEAVPQTMSQQISESVIQETMDTIPTTLQEEDVIINEHKTQVPVVTNQLLQPVDIDTAQKQPDVPPHFHHRYYSFVHGSLSRSASLEAIAVQQQLTPRTPREESTNSERSDRSSVNSRPASDDNIAYVVDEEQANKKRFRKMRMAAKIVGKAAKATKKKLDQHTWIAGPMNGSGW